MTFSLLISDLSSPQAFFCFSLCIACVAGACDLLLCIGESAGSCGAEVSGSQPKCII